MGDNFRIMSFFWNADGLRVCETAIQTEANRARKGYFGKKYPCVAPDFFEGIRSLIRANAPVLVAMGTAEEASSGTYFHSDFLPSRMSDIGYRLLKRDKLDSVGEIPSGHSLDRKDVTNSAVRLSIYAQIDILPEFASQERALKRLIGDDGQETSTCQARSLNKAKGGAIASYVWHPVYGRFAFVCAHLPTGVVTTGRDYTRFRAAVRDANSVCLYNLLQSLVYDLDDTEGHVDHVILFGDLGYEVGGDSTALALANRLVQNVSTSTFRDLLKYDELTQDLKRSALLGFSEGVGGQGPMFMPTWKLKRGRSSSCSPNEKTSKISVPATECFDAPQSKMERPSWRARILTMENGESPYTLTTSYYNRFDEGNTKLSSSAGVVAILDLVPLSI